jgi:hypothetical protein
MSTLNKLEKKEKAGIRKDRIRAAEEKRKAGDKADNGIKIRTYSYQRFN